MTYTRWFMVPTVLALAAMLALAGCSKTDDSNKEEPSGPAVTNGGGSTDGAQQTGDTTTQPDDGGNGQAANSPEAPEGMAFIEIALPRAAYKGTPKDIPPGSTAEKPSDKPRPPFLAPAGVKNVALGKPVTCSDDFPIGDTSLVTDGSKEADEGCWVVAERGPQYVQIDLGAEYELYAVVLWLYHGQMGRIYKDVIVTVSQDPDFIDVTRLFNNDFDNSSGQGAGEDREYFETREGKLIEANKARGRYVRVSTNGSTAELTNEFTEVEVYGLPVSQ